MSTMCVQTLFKKWRSWETTMTVPKYSERKSSSQVMASMSRWLVGSSMRMMSGLPNSACASRIFTFSLPERSPMVWYSKSSESPSPCRSLETSDSASQPFSSANSASSSAAWLPSSSEKSGFAYRASFSCMMA